MSVINIMYEFKDGEIISYSELIKRLPNHFNIRKMLLDIPNRISANNFRVVNINNETRLYSEDYPIKNTLQEWVSIKYNDLGIESINLENDNIT